MSTYDYFYYSATLPNDPARTQPVNSARDLIEWTLRHFELPQNFFTGNVVRLDGRPSPKDDAPYSGIRMALIYCLYAYYPDLKQKEIASLIGAGGHSTISRSYRRAKDYIEVEDPQFMGIYERVRSMCA